MQTFGLDVDYRVFVCRAHRDGISTHALARWLGCSRPTVQRILASKAYHLRDDSIETNAPAATIPSDGTSTDGDT